VRSRGAAALAVLGLSVVTTACGSSPPRAQPRAAPASRPTPHPATTHSSVTLPPPTSAPAATTTTRRPAPAPTAPRPAAPPPAARVARTIPTEASAPTTTAPLPVTLLAGIGAAQQVITVAAGGYGTDTATVRAYEHDATGWKQVFGPWTSYIGRNGVAPPGAKREGDGRTPSGVYGFDFMFGVDPDPGVHFAYRRITGPNIVWDDDPASPAYNEWIDRNTGSAGASPEPMDATPSYLYGVVIAYNDARTPGLGSAIFLHVSHGSPTAGCISLPADELLDLLRWLDPARQPRIAISA
jgi:L,D-peptidoglycan transpeptidase YkuD (ErfK/YbiS/YcfS/YnhG family)